MRLSSKSPKLFSIRCKINGKEGYIRFYSSQDSSGKIEYSCKLVNDITESSKYVNFDNVKEEALKIKNRYSLDEVSVVDDKTMKTFYPH